MRTESGSIHFVSPESCRLFFTLGNEFHIRMREEESAHILIHVAWLRRKVDIGHSPGELKLLFPEFLRNQDHEGAGQG